MTENRKYYLGIDIGSISLKTAILDEQDNLVESSYQRSDGQPIKKLQKHLAELDPKIKCNIAGVGVTGSGRSLASVYVGADLILDEITAQSISASKYYPTAKTIIEIGGQDSKIIVLENQVVKNFAMNTICAAGTGAFLDQQAYRLKVDIEDFGKIALTSKSPTLIAGRCTVFAETDMIHKQQIGIPVEDILAGLCQSLAKNFVYAVAKNIQIKDPVIFQGGVAANLGMVEAFNKVLQTKVIVPKYHDIMPALGVAILVKENNPAKTKFKGAAYLEGDIQRKVWHCDDCANNCELVEVIVDKKKISTSGSVCGKYQ